MELFQSNDKTTRCRGRKRCFYRSKETTRPLHVVVTLKATPIERPVGRACRYSKNNEHTRRPGRRGRTAVSKKRQRHENVRGDSMNSAYFAQSAPGDISTLQCINSQVGPSGVWPYLSPSRDSARRNMAHAWTDGPCLLLSFTVSITQ